MKMDCDETLVIDPDFDWSIMSNLDIHSFHVQAEAPSIVYYRAWIWNTKFPWKFNHDPAHETIAMDVDGIGEGFQRVNLPSSFRMVSGDSYGESYSVPTKYLSDALKLEEKMMRENTLLSDSYHFWYIGKSYNDAYLNQELPLKKIQQDEYARRCIFYFREYVNLFHDFDNTKQPKYIDEMSYFAFYCVGSAYRFIGDIENAIQYYKWAELFCPRRNEHLVCLAQTYDQIEDYAKMLQCTERLIDPERVCPFPEFIFIISTYIYQDKSSYPQYLHNLAVSKLESKLKAELNL
jgi:tetratricopeptide (TPR) repeat protein